MAVAVGRTRGKTMMIVIFAIMLLLVVAVAIWWRRTQVPAPRTPAHEQTQLLPPGRLASLAS